MPKVIQIVTPAYNEGNTIAKFLERFYRVLKKNSIMVQFIVCEDGSTDNTVDELKKLSKQVPIQLISTPYRKGYSRAVLDGLYAATTDFVGFVDSDGQYDPHDFIQLYNHREQTDLVIGFRNPRRDPLHRLVMSRAFGIVYRQLIGSSLKDPSCPYLIINKKALAAILHGKVGVLNQGLWWEFYARALAHGFTIKEIPVRHLPRQRGTTAIYLPKRIPGIAYHHLCGLLTLRKELRTIGSSSRR